MITPASAICETCAEYEKSVETSYFDTRMFVPRILHRIPQDREASTSYHSNTL